MVVFLSLRRSWVDGRSEESKSLGGKGELRYGEVSGDKCRRAGCRELNVIVVPARSVKSSADFGG